LFVSGKIFYLAQSFKMNLTIMQTSLLKGSLVALFMGISTIYAQIINTNTASQLCQGDTITVVFSVTQNLNTGNIFRVELSDPNTVNFSGNFIELTPLAGTSVGGYAMDAVVPATTTQGLYAIRVTGSDPVTVGDTVLNIIVGRKPIADITTFGSFTINNIARFCNGDSVLLVGPPPPMGESHSYRWFDGGVQIPGATNDTLVVRNTGLYSVEVTLGLCSKRSKDTLINMLTLPNLVTPVQTPGAIILSPDSIRVCAGTAAVFRGPPAGAGQNFAYQWLTDTIDSLGAFVLAPMPADTNRNLSTTEPGRYRLVITETTGNCSDTSANYYVVVDSLSGANLVNRPFPGQTTSSLNLCPEDSVFLTLDTTNANWTYQWQISFPIGAPFVTVPFTDPSVVVDTGLVGDSVQVRVIITNGACTDTTNILQINFIAKPTVTIAQGDSIGVCPGDSVLLVAQGTALSYSWNGGLFLQPAIYATSPGTYVVRGIGVNQCDNYDTIVVFLFTPTANAGPNQTVTPGTTVELNGSGGTGFYWFADKPVTFSNPQAATTFTEPTADTTTYYLLVMDGNGCFAIDSMQVFIVNPDPNARFANVMNLITPNGDGLNDVWNISEVMGVDACEVTILNRWGAEVFFSNNYQNNWGGTTTGGDDLPDGTYYYILQCNDEIRLKGAVTILRNELR
jgi:gliding motility-associated-like protein